MATAKRHKIDLRALLKAALDEQPSDDFAAHVMERLSLLKTAIELGRLVGVAPVSGAAAIAEGDTEKQKGESDDDTDE